MWYAPRCPPCHPQQGQFFQHKGCTVRLGPPQAAGGGRGVGVGLRNGRGSRVAGGAGRGSPAGPRTSLVSSGLPPSSVLQRCGGAWGRLGSPINHGETQLSGAGSAPGLFPGGALGPGRILSSHLDFIVLLGISKLEGVCLHCAGHGGPAGCLGSPPLFVQALPRSPSLGKHLPGLWPGIYLSVVVAALPVPVPPACSPVPARGHVSRCTGILFHRAGPHLSCWAQPSSYPIGAVSTGLGA